MYLLRISSVDGRTGVELAAVRALAPGVAPAAIVDGGDGNLYCRPRPMQATRADATPPRFMDAATAQKIRDAAWLEMVERVSNEWKPPA